MDNHYYATVNNLANNIASYEHTTHVTKMAHCCYAILSIFKVGETTQVMPSQILFIIIKICSVVPTSTSPANDEQKQQLWYYQYQTSL